jgi:CRISPR/Cas system-associated endonuclease Cas1
MARLTVSRELISHLVEAKGEVEVCDEKGETLGFFVPPAEHHELVYAWMREQFKDEKELERARAEIRAEGGLTTAEVLAYLRSLGQSGRAAS